MTEILRQLIRQTRLWQVALLISMAVILWLATSNLEHPIQISSWDKINHLVAFIELSLLIRLGWPQLRIVYSALALISFGLLIEIIQAPLPYRSFSLLDLVADSLGIALGLLLWRLSLRRLSENT